MRFAYVLPDPSTYPHWDEFDADLECLRDTGYDAVEIQIADPADLDEPRLMRSLERVGRPLCAFQTGTTYATRGNSLCTPDESVRARTIALLRSFVDFAARHDAVLVFGSLQGRERDEPDLAAGAARIVEALTEIGRYATERGATVCCEPVNHLEVAYHHTIESVHALVARIAEPGLQMMVDAFHINIEEADACAPLEAIRDALVHVHLSETNRDVLGTGHWPTGRFLEALSQIEYRGVCSVGVYHTERSRRECMHQCMEVIRASRPGAPD